MGKKENRIYLHATICRYLRAGRIAKGVYWTSSVRSAVTTASCCAHPQPFAIGIIKQAYWHDPCLSW